MWRKLGDTASVKGSSQGRGYLPAKALFRNVSEFLKISKAGAVLEVE